MGTAKLQGHLWGARARSWAELQELAFEPLYRAAFEAAGVAQGVRLLDVGCGAGLALAIARDFGAEVSGIDAAEGLIEIARQRLPGADLRVGELEQLPWRDGCFDIVTGFNSFQYAEDRVHGLQEAARTMTADGRLVAAVWGQPDQCQMADYLAALGRCMPAPPPNAPGPWALSPPGALEALLRTAGLKVIDSGEATTVFRFANDGEAREGLLASGPAVRAVEHSGEDATAAAVAEAIERFRAIDGSYEMLNVFRFVVARKE